MGDWQLHFSQGNGSIIENAQGDIVGCILWWDYGDEYATVGLVVVPAHMQGNGLGRKLMDTVMSQTGERSLQLVATVAGKRLYQQCGFTEAALIYQVQGQLAGAVEPLPDLRECPLGVLSILGAGSRDGLGDGLVLFERRAQFGTLSQQGLYPLHVMSVKLAIEVGHQLFFRSGAGLVVMRHMGICFVHDCLPGVLFQLSLWAGLSCPGASGLPSK